MTLTIPISRFRRLLFAVLQAIAPARASAAAHAQLSQLYDRWGTAVFRKAWLLRVAINLSKNKLNSAWFKRTDTLEESYPCADLDSNLAFVWDAVRALPSKYREPIHLFYHEGYSTAEIARILGQKESTVRSLLHRGRSMLKETLKEAYDFDE